MRPKFRGNRVGSAAPMTEKFSTPGASLLELQSKTPRLGGSCSCPNREFPPLRHPVSNVFSVCFKVAAILRLSFVSVGWMAAEFMAFPIVPEPGTETLFPSSFAA